MEEEVRCNFCGLALKEVRGMIAGHNVHICSRCVIDCFEILEKENHVETQTVIVEKPPSKEDIKKVFDGLKHNVDMRKKDGENKKDKGVEKEDEK